MRENEKAIEQYICHENVIVVEDILVKSSKTFLKLLKKVVRVSNFRSS